MTKVKKVEETEDMFPIRVYKSYAQYAKESKKKKFNPELLAPKGMALPSSMRPRVAKKAETPPLDQVKTRRRVSA